MDISVNTAFGLESLAKRECEKLGYVDLKAKNGRLLIKGGNFDLARLNVNLRTAERVMIVAGSFTAMSFDELFEGVKAIEWQYFLNENAKVTVTSKCVKSVLMSARSCQSITKKAIVEKHRQIYSTEPTETGEEYKIECSLYENVATISIDSSGEGLHKRGYRDLSAVAPLKETLGAALVLLSGYKGEGVFADCFCGSGTIPIEAAMIANNIAPNINRWFAFNKWKNFPDRDYARAIEQAKSNIKMTKTEIIGRDIDADCVKMSLRHAKRAGVENAIQFSRADMRDYKSVDGGYLVSNLPYGERLSGDMNALYTDLGRMYARLNNYNAVFLTPCMVFEKLFNRKAVKKRKLFNANIECCLYSFTQLKNYQGKR
ncbi:MAG: class I SAM-dependent RNA methyltransferase [Clostridia bacterium]|nr:class I SAM-dependent RNA methyltransferase [Clostridia bacterium]